MSQPPHVDEQGNPIGSPFYNEPAKGYLDREVIEYTCDPAFRQLIDQMTNPKLQQLCNDFIDTLFVPFNKITVLAWNEANDEKAAWARYRQLECELLRQVPTYKTNHILVSFLLNARQAYKSLLTRARHGQEREWQRGVSGVNQNKGLLGRFWK